MLDKKLLMLTLALVMLTGFAFAESVADGLDDPIAERMDKAAQEAELKEYLVARRHDRLALERRQVAAEIEEGLLFDPAQIKAALKELNANPKHTYADNAQRICRAFAKVDQHFGKAWALFAAGDFQAAATAVKPFVSSRDTSYLAAAKRYCYARALEQAGRRNEDAVDAYTDIVKELPGRFSFPSLALLNAGATYERMHRRLYAMALYETWIDTFGVLDPDKADELADIVKEIAADYSDPLASLANKMNGVAERLSLVDSGRDTQKRQKDIVAMLDDLIATAEESASSSSKKQQQQQKQKKDGECSSCGKPGHTAGECKSGGQGGKSGPAGGLGIPSTGATASRLTGGAPRKAENLSEVRPSDGTDDWGKLPPRDRAKMLEGFKESMPERYRNMLRDYYRSLASRGAPDG